MTMMNQPGAAAGGLGDTGSAGGGSGSFTPAPSSDIGGNATGGGGNPMMGGRSIILGGRRGASLRPTGTPPPQVANLSLGKSQTGATDGSMQNAAMAAAQTQAKASAPGMPGSQLNQQMLGAMQNKMGAAWAEYQQLVKAGQLMTPPPQITPDQIPPAQDAGGVGISNPQLAMSGGAAAGPAGAPPVDPTTGQPAAAAPAGVPGAAGAAPSPGAPMDPSAAGGPPGAAGGSAAGPPDAPIDPNTGQPTLPGMDPATMAPQQAQPIDPSLAQSASQLWADKNQVDPGSEDMQFQKMVTAFAKASSFGVHTLDSDKHLINSDKPQPHQQHAGNNPVSIAARIAHLVKAKAGFGKQGWQHNDAPPQSATGEAKGLGYAHKSDDYDRGPDAWKNSAKYLKHGGRQDTHKFAFELGDIGKMMQAHPNITGAIGGGLVGGGLGYLSGDEKKGRKMRTLMSALAGAGLGSVAGGGYDVYKNYDKYVADPAIQQAVAELHRKAPHSLQGARLQHPYEFHNLTNGQMPAPGALATLQATKISFDKKAAQRSCETCGNEMRGAWCGTCKKFNWAKKSAGAVDVWQRLTGQDLHQHQGASITPVNGGKSTPQGPSVQPASQLAAAVGQNTQSLGLPRFKTSHDLFAQLGKLAAVNFKPRRIVPRKAGKMPPPVDPEDVKPFEQELTRRGED